MLGACSASASASAFICCCCCRCCCAHHAHTQVLGRADNLSAFVMHNVKEDASVTVELYRPNGKNLNIMRTFSRKNNKSVWHMDGRCVCCVPYILHAAYIYTYPGLHTFDTPRNVFIVGVYFLFF